MHDTARNRWVLSRRLNVFFLSLPSALWSRAVFLCHLIGACHETDDLFFLDRDL